LLCVDLYDGRSTGLLPFEYALIQDPSQNEDHIILKIYLTLAQEPFGEALSKLLLLKTDAFFALFLKPWIVHFDIGLWETEFLDESADYLGVAKEFAITSLEDVDIRVIKFRIVQLVPVAIEASKVQSPT
jgi:hypothetical protein